MKRNLFFRFFPPPSFLRMPITGIDISDEMIRYARLKETGHGLEVDVYGERSIPKEAVMGGEIKNPELVRKTLKELAQKEGIPFACVSLPEEKAYVVQLRIPHMSRSEIRGSLELQFEEQIPIPVVDAVFDYDIIKETDEHLEVGLFAMPRDTAEAYLSIFENTGIVPLGFRIESDAISRAVVPQGDKGTFMVIDFEHRKTSISIVSNQAVQFTSSLPIGGHALITSVAKSLGTSEDEARTLIEEKGVPLEDKENENIFMALIPVLSSLRDEINKHYMYWQTHNDQYGKERPRIDKLLLCGEGAMIQGIADYLSSGLHTTVELADTMVNIRSSKRYVPEMDYTDSFKYVTALGLAASCQKH